MRKFKVSNGAAPAYGNPNSVAGTTGVTISNSITVRHLNQLGKGPVTLVNNSQLDLSLVNYVGFPQINVISGTIKSNNIFAGAAAAYSLRIPAGNTYNGPLLRVRRSSDNAEADIGAVTTADANGNRWLDTNALLAHVGIASGFVRTWYEQSGNGRHSEQANTVFQPRIVNAGVVDKLNGVPTVFSPGFCVLSAPAPMANSAELTLSLVECPTTFSIGLTTWAMAPDPTRVQAHVPWADGNVYFDLGGVVGGDRISGPLGVAANTPFIATFQASVSQNLQQVYCNGTIIVGDASGHASLVSYLNLIGRGVNADESLRGAFAECIVYPASLSGAKRLELVRNQGTAFGIAVA